MPSEEKLFTYDEVKEIVSRALYVKEDQLREEYNQILFERLQGFFFPHKKNFVLFSSSSVFFFFLFLFPF